LVCIKPHGGFRRIVPSAGGVTEVKEAVIGGKAVSG